MVLPTQAGNTEDANKSTSFQRYEVPPEPIIRTCGIVTPNSLTRTVTVPTPTCCKKFTAVRVKVYTLPGVRSEFGTVATAKVLLKLIFK